MSDIPRETTDGSEPAIAPPSRVTLWALRVVALIAFLISGYLARLAYTGETAAGCGRNSDFGCEHVLTSRWAFWISVVGESHAPIDVPVSIVASALWLTVLMVSIFARVSFAPRLQRVSWILLTVLATAALGAAVWFVALQALRLHHWCLYCMAAHACALVAWVLVIGQRQLPTRVRLTAIGLGLVAFSLMPLGQYAFPFVADHIKHVADATDTSPEIIAGIAPAGDDRSPRYVDVLGGATRLDITHLPRLGDLEARYFVVLLSDYSCSFCRELHHELAQAQELYRGELTVVLLPKPLESLTAQPQPLGKLALMVWYLEPDRFVEFDAWLFEPISPRKFPEARQRAVELVGEERLATAEADKRFDDLIQQSIDLYDRSPGEFVPQILGRNVVFDGIGTLAELLEALEQDFGFSRP